MQRNLRSVLHCGTGGPAADEDADKALRTLEMQAWGDYREIRQSLAIPRMDEVLAQYIARRIMPGFSKLGFDHELIPSMMGLASGVWKSLARCADNVVGLHPAMRNDLNEVRQGLLIQAEKKMASGSATTFLTPQDSYDIVRQSMDPANLHQALDDIATPWIILPRAHGVLQQDQAHYLPAYLEMIDKETNEEALHIFTRIAIEFIANFSIRYADAHQPRKQVARLVVAGYKAMYWKSLHTPPVEYEDVRVFEHFLSWMKHSDSHAMIASPKLDTAIRIMEAYKKRIFLYHFARHPDHPKHPDNTRFLVALRHGCLGIAGSVRYFAGKPPAHGKPFDKGLAWGTLLFDLKSLFDMLVDRYGTESRRTQYYIRDFIFQLKNAFALTLTEDLSLGSGDTSGREFLQARIAVMIHRLQLTLVNSPLR